MACDKGIIVYVSAVLQQAAINSPTYSPGSTTVFGCHRIQWHEIAHSVGVFIGADAVGYRGSEFGPHKNLVVGVEPPRKFY